MANIETMKVFEVIENSSVLLEIKNDIITTNDGKYNDYIPFFTHVLNVISTVTDNFIFTLINSDSNNLGTICAENGKENAIISSLTNDKEIVKEIEAIYTDTVNNVVISFAFLNESWRIREI